MTLRENGLLCGWWVRIWRGAGRQPAHAHECLDLFQNINLIRRQQPSASDSLIWWKSRKVQPDSAKPLFSSVLMRQDLRVADSSYLPWNEAYDHSLSLSSHLFLVPCYEGEPNERHFFADIFIKRWFCSKKSCRICCMLAKYGLKFMISHAQSLGFEFHIQVDFGFNGLFSHIFSFLYHNSGETSWFSLMRHEKQLTEEKCMQYSIDTRTLMLSPTNSPQSAFAR